MANQKPDLTAEEIYAVVDSMKKTDLAELKIAVVYSAIFGTMLVWVSSLDLMWQINLTWIVAVTAFIAHYIIRKKERD